MLDPRTFLGAVLAGQESADQIDLWVDRWHEGEGKSPLRTLLGFTEEEYTNWMLAPASLPHMIEVRRLVEAARGTLQLEVAKDAGLQ